MAYKFYITDMSSIFVCITCEFYLMTNFDNKIVRQLMNDYKPLRLFLSILMYVRYMAIFALL